MNRGEVWLLNLEPTLGDEMRKTRPVIAVNDDFVGTLSLKIIVPVTDWKDKYSEVVWMTKIEPNSENGLTKISAADAFQIRSVSKQRFLKRIGTMKNEKMLEIEKKLAIILKLKFNSLYYA